MVEKYLIEWCSSTLASLKTASLFNWHYVHDNITLEQVKSSIDEMNEKFNTKRGFIKAKWCGSAECEDEIKAATGGATTRCICKEDQVKDGDTCIFCGKQAKHVVYFGKAY